jgi:hypothetical protein
LVVDPTVVNTVSKTKVSFEKVRFFLESKLFFLQDTIDPIKRKITKKELKNFITSYILTQRLEIY